jgi:predicted phage terminase large subunit-like protein
MNSSLQSTATYRTGGPATMSQVTENRQAAVMRQRAAIQKERVRREKRRRAAQSNLCDFIGAVDEIYDPQWYHIVLGRFLDRFARGEIKRGMIWMPAQHGKSYHVSEGFPAYAIGQNPDLKLIHTSYAAELVQKMNRSVQRIMDREEYQRIFPEARLNSKNIRTLAGSYLRNNDIFEIVGKRGQYRCAGVGGGISGFPGDLAILDDPYKDYKEATSPTVRRAVWEWYTSTFLNRTHKRSSILICNTRWHPNDISGELIAKEGDAYHGGRWYVLKLPALCEDPEDESRRLAFALNCSVEDLPHRRVEGEALWEDRFDRELLLERKKLNPHQFKAMGQQNPENREGALFAKDQFNKVAAIPADAKRAIWWDLASTEDGDWTAGVLMAQYGGRYGIEEVYHFRKKTHDRNAEILKIAHRHREKYDNRVKIYIPKDGSGEASDYLIQLLSGYPVEAHREKGSKLERAEPFADQVQAGNVDYLEADWNDDYFEELESFTGQGDTYDDQVDGSSGVFNRLALGKTYSFQVRSL